jgi:hypothetical protein
MADFTKDEEVRIHALNLAASTYREVFRIGKEDGESPVSDQVLADAAKYAAFIQGGASS